MYQKQFKQLSFADFILPFEGSLDPDNRWVKLAETIPWYAAEQIYAKNFTAPNGTPAYSVRVALGSLIIKETLCLSDIETVAHIQEGPYLQYFIGYEKFSIKAPFDPSLMTHFRKRFSLLNIADVQECLYQQYSELLEQKRLLQEQEDDRKSHDSSKKGSKDTSVNTVVAEKTHETPVVVVVETVVIDGVSDEPVQAVEKSVNDSVKENLISVEQTLEYPSLDESAQVQEKAVVVNESVEEEIISAEQQAAEYSAVNEPELNKSVDIVEPPANKGQLILDATCAPADIRYPTDLGLLNEAREKTEKIIDKLYEHAPKGVKKPRTYRKTARKEFLHVTKLKRKPAKTLRKVIGKQLTYLERNLKSIEALSCLVSLTVLDRRLYGKLLVCSELYRQQKEMYDKRRHQINDRIVSISQPHVRAIVRGKASAKTEFGIKISLSVDNQWCRVERMSWNAYNEGCDLITEVERYRERKGYYPESVHVDKLYRTKTNRKWCQTRGIRMSGTPLGRPPKDAEVNAERKRQIRKDEGIRNAVEGKFGQAKRRFGMNRIMAKLSGTSETVVALIVMVMNLQQLLSVHFLRHIEQVVLIWNTAKAYYSRFKPKSRGLVILADSIRLSGISAFFLSCF